jgi:hypothetical protein
MPKKNNREIRRTQFYYWSIRASLAAEAPIDWSSQSVSEDRPEIDSFRIHSEHIKKNNRDKENIILPLFTTGRLGLLAAIWATIAQEQIRPPDGFRK